MRSSVRRRDKYAAKVRGLVIPGQGDRYRNNIMPRIKLEQCVKAAGITPMLQFSYVAYLEELLKHDAARRPMEAQGIVNKWSNRGLDAATLTAVANCMGISAAPPTPPPPCEYSVDANTIALWHCDDGAGVNLTDETGNNNGAFRGPGEPAWTTNYWCPTHALLFDGVDDFVTCGNHASASPTVAITLECWVYMTARKLCFFIGKWVSEERQYYLGVNVSVGQFGELWFGLSHAGENNEVFGLTPVPLDRWVHVAGTFDGTDMKVWLDGVVDNTKNSPGPINTGNQILTLGSYSGAPGIYTIKGRMDEIRMSNIARSF